MTESGPVAVLGATGQVGSAVTRALDRLGVPSHALIRSGRPAAPGVSTRVVPEWTEEGLVPAFAGCTSAFVMVPLVEHAVELGRTAHAALERAGVRRVVRLSVLGGVIDDELTLGRLHAALDADLAARDLASAVLRPDSFMQNLLGSATSMQQGSLTNATGDGRMALIDADDIGECAAALLAGTAPWPDTPLDLTGPELLTHGDVARRTGRWLGHAVRYEDVSPPALHAMLLDFGVPGFLAGIFAELAAWTRRVDREEVMTDHVPRLLGRSGHRLETFLQAHASVFAPAAPD